MKLKNGYLLYESGGASYLLPYGQNIADHRHGMRLNESGKFLYTALLRDPDLFADCTKQEAEQKLLALLLAHYEANASEAPALLADIKSFLSHLQRIDALSDSEVQISAPERTCFRIGPLTLEFCGPKELIPPSFFPFSCKPGPKRPDQTVYLFPSAPLFHAGGEVLIRTEELMLLKNEECYLFLYPAGHGISEVHLSLDGQKAIFYCHCPFSDDLPEQLFHAIRFTFLVKAQMEGLFAVHSASVLYRGKAWLFAAPSGTGKSTHAALWNSLYKTPVLNGDLNLIGFSDDKPIVYGIPWCGTSAQFTANAYPLGGIVFLSQASHDSAAFVTAEKAQLSVMRRMVSPAWTKAMLSENLNFAGNLSKKIPFFSLACTKEASAAAALKKCIDSALTTA